MWNLLGRKPRVHESETYLGEITIYVPSKIVVGPNVFIFDISIVADEEGARALNDFVNSEPNGRRLSISLGYGNANTRVNCKRADDR